jgi:hypothetical protein
MRDMSEHEDLSWRSRMLDDLKSDDIKLATDALLSLTYNEQDSNWTQDLLLGCVDSDRDLQIRALAVTCLGHVARLTGKIRADVVEKLRQLTSDPGLGGRAEDALDDVASFVSHNDAD